MSLNILAVKKRADRAVSAVRGFVLVCVCVNEGEEECM